MEVHDEHIPDDLFSEFTARMPECCIEVVVQHDGGVLLAKRSNEPAKGEWFWPGGRLYKGETFEAAVHRIAREELGLNVEIFDRLGVYSHYWDSSAVAGEPSRHTVNVVFLVRPAETNPTIELDDQHDDYRILTTTDNDLHKYVQLYIEDASIL